MLEKKVQLILPTLILLVCFATLNFQVYHSQIDMRINRLNDFYLFYLAAFSGIAMTLLLSMLITKNKLLEYIGKHSIVLFGWHTLLFTYFKHISFFPPAQYEFLTPTIHLTFATAIILLTQMLYRRTRKVFSLSRRI
jgi:fucose 4-O-acetylase-like acetyltransferase